MKIPSSKDVKDAKEAKEVSLRLSKLLHGHSLRICLTALTTLVAFTIEETGDPKECLEAFKLTLDEVVEVKR